jgi:hypothetical protein
MRSPRYGSAAWKVRQELMEAEAKRPKSNTNWTHPFTNFFLALNALRKALASGENAKLERRFNEDCEYPIRINPSAPWKEQVSKHFKHKLWVVVLYYNYPKIKVPVLVHILNVVAYPLKFIPEKSIMRMDNYSIYTFRIGSVINGYSVEFQIPKKFNFKN